jgi:predicted Zn-dependent protease
MRKFLSLALAVAAAFPALAKDSKNDPSAIGDRRVSGRVNFFSIEQEIALGKQLAIEVEKQARIIDDLIVSEYVNRLGQNLARNSDVNFPVSFKVIDSDDINAFTLPGGFIFINSGLVKLSGNESELASAIAHEIGHVAARHATRQATRSQLISMGTLPVSILGGWTGLIAGQTASRLVAPLASMKFSREFETEADLLGLQYLWKTGYDPNASIDLFETLQSTERRQPGSVSRLFRTHPLTPDRIQKTQKNIDQLLPAMKEYVVNTSEYEEVRARLMAEQKTTTVDSNGPTLHRR